LLYAKPVVAKVESRKVPSTILKFRIARVLVGEGPQFESSTIDPIETSMTGATHPGTLTVKNLQKRCKRSGKREAGASLTLPVPTQALRCEILSERGTSWTEG
jgi:hypothetical protein